MKTYWLVAVLFLVQIILPFTHGKGADDEDDPMQVIAEFVKTAVVQLKDDPDFASKVKDIFGDLKEAFSGQEFAGTFIPAVTQMLDSFLNDGYFLAPETALKLMKSVINQSTREPDKLSNNLRRVWHRSVKTVGNTIQNVGSLGSSVVRVVEDLHNKQVAYMNPLYDQIPYLGTVLKRINIFVAKFLGAVHMVVKLGVKGTGTIISDYAEQRRQNLKQKTAKEKKAAKKTEELDDEDDENADSDEEPDKASGKAKPKKKEAPGKKDPDSKSEEPKKEEGDPPKRPPKPKPKPPVKRTGT